VLIDALVQKPPVKKAQITKYSSPKKHYKPSKKCQLVLFKPKKAPHTSKNSRFGTFAPTLVTLCVKIKKSI